MSPACVDPMGNGFSECVCASPKKQNKTKQHKTKQKQNKTNQNKTKQNKTKTRLGGYKY